MKKKQEVSLVRSSAAEYLTFVAACGGAKTSVEMRYEDENLGLTQKMMATIYDVTVPAINQHLKRIFADNELDEEAVVKQYLITAADGKNYRVKHYSLQAIMRYRILHHASRSHYGLQIADYCNWAVFRKWQKGEVEFYDLIKPAVKSEFDIFRMGTTLYY